MPPTLTYPGVYIEELPSGVNTITGVATSIAAFAGWAPQGPTDQAGLVQSWTDFQNLYGGLYPGALLGYSVNQFFANGGQQAYIVRLSNSQAATVTIPTGDTTAGDYVFTSAQPGLNGVNLTVVSAGSTFTLQVLIGTTLIESHTGLTVPSFVGAVNSQSELVSVALSSTGNQSPTQNLAAGSYSLAFPTTAFTDPVDTVGCTVLMDAETTPAPALLILAQSTGSWSGNYGIVIQNGGTSSNLTSRFGLQVVYNPPGATPSVVESYPNLSMNPNDPQNRYVSSVIAAASTTIQAVVVNANANSPATISSTSPQELTGGNVGSPLQPKPVGDGLFENLLQASGGAGGINLLTLVPLFNLVAVPGLTDPATLSDLQAFCVNNRAFLIVDCASTDNFTTLQNGPNGSLVGSNSTNSALYFPWVQAPDPLQQGRLDYFPPCGFVAGNYAATDGSRGVWKSPAGTEVSLTGATGLGVTLTDLQNGTLNIQAINCLRNFPVYGNVVWGARTLQGNDQAGSQWKYVCIRRLALYLETSLLQGTQWVVFEPNDENLWGQIRLNVGSFLQGLFLKGAFQGTTPQQAYFVKCDGENNPDSSIAQGIVNILVGFAPLYPAEFVVIQIQQMAGQG